MKVLLVSHGFPPEQAAGAEVYAAATAHEFVRRGHDVVVLAPTGEGDRDYELRERKDEHGVRVVRMTNRYRELYDLSWTYANPRIAAVVEQFLRRERPDVVHVHHTVGTTIDVVDAAHAVDAPVVATLHDWWFLCPRGQRLMPNGHHCVRIDHARCARCIASKRLAYAGKAARGWLTGEHPAAPRSAALRLATAVPSVARQLWRESGPAPLRRRSEALLAGLARADAVLAPSRFLGDEYVRSGLRQDRVRHWPYGIDHTPFSAQRRRAADDARARFAYVGSLQPSKGVDLLVRAFRDLPRDKARLAVHGAPTEAAGEAYVRELQHLAGPADVRFAGPFAHARIAAILADVDVLVVPSRWYENWPLSLLESVLAGVASVTTDHGGMREFAATFGTAVTFAPDDAGDLARALRRFVDEPGLAVSLGAHPRAAVRRIEDDANDLLALYEELRSGPSWRLAGR